jgi:hypothetical protein
MKATSLHFTSLALLSVLSCSVASAALTDYTFVGGTTDPADNSTFEILANWEANGAAATLLPGMNDDVTATANFLLRSTTTDYTIKSLTLDGGAGTLAAKKLTVTGDVTMNSRMTVKNAGTVFEWGGTATIYNTLEMVLGGGVRTKVVGKDLDVATNGEIYFRWYDVPNANSAAPEIDLSGVLDFAADSVFEIKLEGGNDGVAQTEGSYFLVGSETITGTLPSLSLLNWTADQGTYSYLSVDDTNADTSLQGLYLNVIPEPATIGMLGLGALITLLVRRMRL